MLVFLGGALAGAATALMLSPKCGADLRDSIKEMIDKEMGAIRERYHDIKEHVHSSASRRWSDRRATLLQLPS